MEKASAAVATMANVEVGSSQPLQAPVWRYGILTLTLRVRCRCSYYYCLPMVGQNQQLHQNGGVDMWWLGEELY